MRLRREASRTGRGFVSWADWTRAGPLSFEGLQRDSRPRPRLRTSGYGREPVGKGQAAAGFSAGRAPGVAASDGAAGADAVGSAVLAVGVAALNAFFFFPAFFFFLADFFAAAFLLPAFFNALFFFPDAFLFFFFFPPFFAFFFAMLYSFKVVEQKKPGRLSAGLSNRRRGIAAAGMLNGVGPRGEVLIEDIAVEPDTSFPGDCRGVRIDAHLLELAHVAPELEGANLEQVAEEHRAFEPILE